MRKEPIRSVWNLKMTGRLCRRFEKGSRGENLPFAVTVDPIVFKETYQIDDITNMTSELLIRMIREPGIDDTADHSHLWLTEPRLMVGHLSQNFTRPFDKRMAR